MDAKRALAGLTCLAVIGAGFLVVSRFLTRNLGAGDWCGPGCLGDPGSTEGEE